MSATARPLSDAGLMDFDDILLQSLSLNEGPVPLGGHLLVDEFQDINPAQYRLIRAWGANAAGVFVIGDPDQAIYGFRGADPRLLRPVPGRLRGGKGNPPYGELPFHAGNPQVRTKRAQSAARACGRAGSGQVRTPVAGGGRIRRSCAGRAGDRPDGGRHRYACRA